MNEPKGFSKDLNDIMQFPEGGIFSTVLAKSDDYNYTLMCLSRGSGIETHTSKRDGIVLVLKGKGVFSLFERKIKMKTGTFIFMPKDAPHSIEAEEDLAILLCLA